VVPLCRLPAVIVVLRPAVMLPSLVIAPPTATLTSFAPRRLPPLASEPAWMPLRSVAALMVPPLPFCNWSVYCELHAGLRRLDAALGVVQRAGN
jgi:hypothetical protein